jgi:nitroreductase
MEKFTLARVKTRKIVIGNTDNYYTTFFKNVKLSREILFCYKIIHPVDATSFFSAPLHSKHGQTPCFSRFILYWMKGKMMRVFIRGKFIFLAHVLVKEEEFGMDVLEVVRSRRIIKKFKPDQIDRDMLVSCLELGAMAPNHRMTEPWEIVFIGPETRAKLQHKTNFGNAPVLFAVLSKKGKNELEREENRSATSCFIQNFMLAAWANGVGTFWSSIGASEKNRKILGVSDDVDIIGVLAVGYPEEIPEAKPRTPIRKKIRELP